MAFCGTPYFFWGEVRQHLFSEMNRTESKQIFGHILWPLLPNSWRPSQCDCSRQSLPIKYSFLFWHPKHRLAMKSVLFFLILEITLERLCRLLPAGPLAVPMFLCSLVLVEEACVASLCLIARQLTVMSNENLPRCDRYHFQLLGSGWHTRAGRGNYGRADSKWMEGWATNDVRRKDNSKWRMRGREGGGRWKGDSKWAELLERINWHLLTHTRTRAHTPASTHKCTHMIC